MPYYLGVDAGTTKIAAVVVDSTTGQTVATHELPNDSEITTPQDKARGRSEWDAQRAARLCLDCMAAAVANLRSREIAAIGVTGQMHGMTLLGPDGAPTCPFIGWQDQRCQEQVSGLDRNYIQLMLELAGPGEFDRSGCPPATGYMASTLFWLARNGWPGVRRSAAGHPEKLVACFLPDFVVTWLTGTPPVTDPTNAAGAGVFDVAAGVWNVTLIARIGLSAEMFPPVVRSATVVGGLSKEAAVALDLRPGTPVCAACGDNQASFAGSVAEPAASVLVNVGTGAQVSAWVPRHLSVQDIDTRPHLDGGFLLVGAPLCGGLSYALLRNFFAQAGRDLFHAEESADLYEAMNRLAASVPPGSDGLRCEPLFSGTRLEPDRRGSFTGLSAANFTPAHFARAVLEGVAEELRGYYTLMLKGGIEPRTRLVSCGNGVRRNRLLAEILSRAFGMPLRMSANSEEAAYGAALLAAVGAGEFRSLHEACKAIRYM